jgi:hypothetical protein
MMGLFYLINQAAALHIPFYQPDLITRDLSANPNHEKRIIIYLLPFCNAAI